MANSPEIISGPPQGFWRTAWRRYRKDRFSMFGFYILILMFAVAFFAPLIVGIKPLICYYQGSYYFPFMGYYNESWENAVFKTRDQFGDLYPGNLQRQPKALLEKAKEKQTRFQKKIDRLKQDEAKISTKIPNATKIIEESEKTLTPEEKKRVLEAVKTIKELQQSSRKTPDILAKHKEDLKNMPDFDLWKIAQDLETPEERKMLQHLLPSGRKEAVDLLWIKQDLKQQETLLTEVAKEITERTNETQDPSKNWAIYPLVFADPFDKMKTDDIRKLVKEGYIASDSWVAHLEPTEVNSPPPKPLPLKFYNAFLRSKTGVSEFKIQLEEKIQHLQEEIQKLSATQESGATEKIQSRQAELKKLQEKQTQVLQKIQEIEKESTPLQEKLAPLKEQKAQQESAIRTAQGLLKNEIREVQSLESEIELLESQTDPASSEALKQAKERLQQKQAEQEKNSVALYQQIEDAKTKIGTLEPQIEALSEQIEAFTETIEILEGKKSRIQKQRLQHLFGTDMYGRDVFARIIHGTRIALLIGFVSMGIASIIGIIMGGIAGFFGGWVDSLISRFIDLIMAIPTMILILALIAIVERPTIWDLMIVIGLTSWVTIARLTRGEFLKLKNMDYVMAGQALGFSHFRIMFRHILPNSLAPVIVNVTFGIASAILTESGLSFLGFGVQEPTPSWGNILSNGFKSGLTDYWLIGSSSFAIFVAIFTYNIVGDGLQEALDPRLK